MQLNGTVIKYGDNVDTDVIIPARYLNTIDKKELASHCMEDLDTTFTSRVKPGDIMVGGENLGCGSSRHCSGHCQELCPHQLPELYQHRSGDRGVSGGCRRYQRGRHGGSRSGQRHHSRCHHRQGIPCGTVSGIYPDHYRKRRSDRVDQKGCCEVSGSLKPYDMQKAAVPFVWYNSFFVV